jgi:hypothetical protein
MRLGLAEFLCTGMSHAVVPELGEELTPGLLFGDGRLLGNGRLFGDRGCCAVPCAMSPFGGLVGKLLMEVLDVRSSWILESQFLLFERHVLLRGRFIGRGNMRIWVWGGFSGLVVFSVDSSVRNCRSMVVNGVDGVDGCICEIIFGIGDASSVVI